MGVSTIPLRAEVLDLDYRRKFFFFMAFNAGITLLVQGSTTSALLKVCSFAHLWVSQNLLFLLLCVWVGMLYLQLPSLCGL